MKFSQKILLGISALCLAVFGLIALFCPLGMMQWIGFSANQDTAVIEFMSFYGGLELGLSVLFLLPHTFFGVKEKLLCVLFIFGSVGLTRLFAMLPDQIDSIFCAIAAFELGLATTAVVLLQNLVNSKRDHTTSAN